MAEIKWTDEQLEAITSSGEAVLVSAAAGSGKTTVLIEKLKRLLTDSSNDVSADNIVVVTFTNDAAAQMKNRLHRELTNALEDDDCDISYISEQISLIPIANISTIHSFCFRLIRENAGVLGLDPGFGIAEPSDEDHIVIKAIDNVFEQMYDDRPQTIERLLSVFCPNDKDATKLKEIIKRLRTKLLALPFPEGFAEERTENYLRGISAYDNIMAEYSAMINAELQKAYLYAEAAERFITEHWDEIPDKKRSALLENVKKDMYSIKDVAERYEKRADSPLSVLDAEEIVLIKFNIPGFTLNDGTAGNKILKDYIIDKYRGICCDYLKVSFDNNGTEIPEESTPKSLFTPVQIKNDYRIHAEICEMLFDIISRLREEEKRLKSEKNVLGFSDAEQYACELLCDIQDGMTVPSKLALELQDKYTLIMVDEFQDSTKIQELIFRMLSKGGNAHKAGSNFFAVGDIKQSIYRFRAAEPSLFEKNLKNKALKKVLLKHNYRSASPIVDLVNTAFCRIMSERNGGIDYGYDDSLIFGNTEPSEELPEVITVTENMAGLYSESTAPYQKAEAEAVAVRIRQMLDSGIKPSDICLLMRTNRQMKEFAESFAKYRIPFEYSASDSILRTSEVRTILDLLRIIDNPTLNVPFAAVLISPLFAFTAEDLARIRLADKTRTIYGDIIVCAEGEDEFASQCRDFLELFRSLREYAMTHTSGELIERIYKKTYAMSVFSVFPDGAQKVSNLRRFAAAADSYDASSPGTGRNISGFVRRMDMLEENDSDIAGEDISTGQAVMMKTLHKSKGLEFPYVFICATTKKFSTKENMYTRKNSQLMFDSDLGIAFNITERINDAGVTKVYESMPAAVLSRKYEKSVRDEEMMLLYVGLTRARKKLFITRCTGGDYDKTHTRNESYIAPQGKCDLAVACGSSYADWIETILHFSDGLVSFSDEIMPGEEESAESAEPVYLEDEAAALRQRIERYSAVSGRHSDMAAKLTVTQITHNNEEEPEKTVHKPKKGLTGTARGTAYHSFMQGIDFGMLRVSPDDNTVEKEKQRMKNSMTQEELDCIENGRILDFAASSLFSRIGTTVFREREFLVRIDDIIDRSELQEYGISSGETMLQGVADLIFLDEEKDCYILVDYKTDRTSDKAELKRRYSRQLILYAKAFSRILDKPVSEAYIYSFESGEIPVMYM